MRIDRMVTDRGNEYCGAHDWHGSELNFTCENIDHTRNKMKSPQNNCFCERFNNTLLDEFYRIAFQKNAHDIVETLQLNLDNRIIICNKKRTYLGR